MDQLVSEKSIPESEEVTKSFTILPLGTMNTCRKLYGKPVVSFQGTMSWTSWFEDPDGGTTEKV